MNASVIFIWIIKFRKLRMEWYSSVMKHSCFQRSMNYSAIVWFPILLAYVILFIDSSTHVAVRWLFGKATVCLWWCTPKLQRNILNYWWGFSSFFFVHRGANISIQYIKVLRNWYSSKIMYFTYKIHIFICLNWITNMQRTMALTL